MQNIISAEYNLINFQSKVLQPVFQNRTADFQIYESSENEEIKESEERIVSQITKYGYLETADGTSIDFYEVYLQPNVLIERNRVTVGNIIRRLMYGNSAAFVNFVYADNNRPDWRFTFIHKAEVFDEDKDNYVKYETEPKRYTYLLGPNESCRTAADRLQTLSQKDKIKIEDIEQAFSVEALSKEFFEKYKQHYEKFVDYLTTSQSLLSHFYDSDRKKQARDFVKKLMGRIVFLYFIQKKGWLGVAENEEWGTGNPNFMSDLFNNSEKDTLFYINYLEPLFFETLNKKRGNDICTINDNKLGRVPFLNGGLFEREFKNGHFLTFPSDFFSNLFSFFDSYNFTIIENDPQNRNVAVDPEMLGHIFENLLEDNKDKGAYYTPKEIVHYMCQESLIEYLNTKLPESNRSDLEQFIKHKRENEFVLKNAKNINNALREVKVCDPAIGSGAFPVGLLMEIYTAKQALHEISGDVNKQTPAEIKQHIIQNSIYGVDIERGAVDIARLRFWLSLIIEETKPQALPNLDYKIMQGNSLVPMYEGEVLEIDWTDDTAKHGVFGQQVATDIKNLLNKIIDKQRRFFAPQTTDKHKVKAEIRNLKIDLLTKQLDLMITTKGIEIVQSNAKGKALKQQTERLLQTKNWKRLKQKLAKHKDTDKPLNYFDWKLDFAEVLNPKIVEQTGFDIVIGNPPYIKEYTNKNAFDGFRNSKYYQGKMDIWYGFACHGIDMTKPKSGILSFIATNNWTTNSGASLMRKRMAENAQIVNILDFNNYKIFENAGIQTMIMIFRNYQFSEYEFDYRRITHSNPNYSHVLNLINGINTTDNQIFNFPFSVNNFEDNTLTFNPLEIELVLAKIKSKGQIYLTAKEVANGIHPHHDFVNNKMKIILGGNFRVGDGIFGLSAVEKDSLNLSEKEKELIKPYYTTKNFSKYYANPVNTEWIIYTGSEFKRKETVKPYPNIKAHLDKFQKVITSDNKPYGLHRARVESFFKGEKIIVQRKCPNEPVFTYTDFDAYVSATFYVIKTNRVNQKYLIALLNSKLITFWLKFRGKMQGNNYQLDKEPLINIPIINIVNTDKFEIIVNQILTLKKDGKDTTDLEREIDKMVYELYCLTDEEIKIVETN